jgi:hypothetical protein
MKTTNKLQVLANANDKTPDEENNSTNHTNNNKPKHTKPPQYISILT